ncbi:prolyl oligopeptidase family serine peptidase [Archangium gephyra]|nr:prolyl oligopeptidase family serine peptidase [Archangium gephyra]
MVRPLAELKSFVSTLFHSSATPVNPSVTCSIDGAPPMQTVEPVTIRPRAEGGEVLSFVQEGVTRYACLNLPAQASQPGSAGRKWPLLIHLHGSRATPASLYSLGKALFALHDTAALSSDPRVRGFLVLSPMGRRARPAGALSGTGFHWDEWYRNPTANLDALAIDHFLDEVVARGLVDTDRIYVFGWSNGAYMAALYGMWRSDRIAAIAQYAGANPWTRLPCPVPMTWTRRVPMTLMRNLCDALVPYSATQEWIETLQAQNWPFEYQSLDLRGAATAPDAVPPARSSKLRGLYEHVRWPDQDVFEKALVFLGRHPLSSWSCRDGSAGLAHPR